MAAAEPAAQPGGAELPGPVAGDAPVSLFRRPSPPRAPTPSESAARLGPGRAHRRVRGAGSRGSTCPALWSGLAQQRPLPVWTLAPPLGKSVGLARLGVDVGRGLRRSGGPPGGGGSGREAPRRDVSVQGWGGRGSEDEQSVI